MTSTTRPSPPRRRGVPRSAYLTSVIGLAVIGICLAIISQLLQPQASGAAEPAATTTTTSEQRGPERPTRSVGPRPVRPRVAPIPPSPRTVAVLADSMLAVGAEISRPLLEAVTGSELIHWDAISGHAISTHPSALTTQADVIVTTFAYNDASMHGWPGAQPWLERFLDTHHDADIVWVTFDPSGSEVMVEYNAWLRGEAGERDNLHLVDFAPHHFAHDTWTCGAACGPLGFHLEPGEGGVAAMATMIADRIEQLAAGLHPTAMQHGGHRAGLGGV